jgi:glutamine synthetase
MAERDLDKEQETNGVESGESATSNTEKVLEKPSKRVSNDDLLRRVEESQVRFIDLQFTDIFGVMKSVTIPANQLNGVLENGAWFDGSAIEGFTRVAEHDMYLVPDPTTFAVIPWSGERDRTARLICWIYTPRGERFNGDPRHALDRVLKEAAQLGYQYNVGPELEFFLFKNRTDNKLDLLDYDKASYFDHSTDQATLVKREAALMLSQMGVQFESFHHEVAPGQHEVDLEVGSALRVADSVVTTKYALKAIAQQNGLKATFMPKPLFGVPGSGMHTHQSLTFASNPTERSNGRNGTSRVIPANSLPGNNAFAGISEQYGLSSTARHFIAGQLYHAKAMTIILAPIINSYKRLVAGYEAPVYISWARVNRGALIRVPHSGPGPNQRYAARLELRCPDPACNPYLAFAVMLKAGLDGIKRRLPLPEPIEESIFQFDNTELRRRNIETLPSTLREAIEELKQDEVIQEALGEIIYENLIEAKMEEWSDYRRHVSPWEVERYLDIS